MITSTHKRLLDAISYLVLQPYCLVSERSIDLELVKEDERLSVNLLVNNHTKNSLRRKERTA
jgi:hypothetical protein